MKLQGACESQMGREEIEMEMRAREDIAMAEEITPNLSPLSFSLFSSSLSSHCSSCFLSLSSSSTITTPFLRYCSSCCSSSDLPLHFSSAEHHLFLLLHPSLPSPDLRVALRLLSAVTSSKLIQPPYRLVGLLTNRHKLLTALSDDRIPIIDGAAVMAKARAMRDGRNDVGDFELEEAALCCVMTNGVEVQINGLARLGIAVNDWCFSWINHSCSPNACYWFSFFSNVPEASVSSRMWIVASQGDDLEPIRQSEMWLKYQFLCSCNRCSALPQTYVDHTLQETFDTTLHMKSSSAINNLYRDKTVGQLKDFLDSTMAEYMSGSDPVMCCEKIENLLTKGLISDHFKPNNRSPHVNFRLSPLHHLSLNAYMSSYSIYKIRASQFIGSEQFEAFNMSRTSAAFCLLLAGATHHMFMSEPSLLVSAATFWISAGESLLFLARSQLWNLLATCLVPKLPSQKSSTCRNCSLMDTFETKSLCTQIDTIMFGNISREFFHCVSNLSAKVWRFLAQGCCYLESIEDPVNFSWLEALRSAELYPCHAVQQNIARADDCESVGEERTNVFQLGVHCLAYGGYLSVICYGHNSYATHHIRSMLNG